MSPQIDILNLRILLAFLAAAGALLLAAGMLARDWRSLTHRLFALAVLLLAAEQFSVALAARSVALEDVFGWTQAGLLCAAIAPAVWFFFILSLEPDRGVFSGWTAWLGGTVLVAPALVALVAWDRFFWGYPVEPRPGMQQISLDQAGYLVCLILVLGCTLMLVSLERALRAAVGHTRWQLKFLLLGLAAIAGVRIYTTSHYLLFAQLDSGLRLIDTAGLLAGECLILVSLRRSRVLSFGLHPSRKLLTRSIVLVAVGVYLLGVGLLSELFRFLDWGRPLQLHVLVVFLGLVGLAVLLLSDRLRQDLRTFTSRHFQRPVHDYREVWTRFTDRTSNVAGVQELAGRVAGFVSETFEILRVDLWIIRQDDRRLAPAASTAAGEDAPLPSPELAGAPSVLKRVEALHGVVDLERTGRFGFNDGQEELERLLDLNTRYLVPLRARDAVVGVLALGPRVRGRALSAEDIDLLQVIAQQTAASLLNIRLSEKLQESRQLEAFQKMSAFFVHDLKNLASRLSLTVQNLPAHFDNPEFRQDALETISQSLTSIRRMTRRLSALKERIELSPELVDLNQILRSTIREVRDQLACPVEEELAELPPVSIDPELFRKVMTNLLLNAGEASPEGGSIQVSSKAENGGLVVSVQDHGTGMSREFIQQRLFRPFQTTKKDGVGIGLFHSKMIVEAHQGKIEVQSQPGKGTTFQVYLPQAENLKNQASNLK